MAAAELKFLSELSIELYKNGSDIIGHVPHKSQLPLAATYKCITISFILNCIAIVNTRKMMKLSLGDL